MDLMVQRKLNAYFELQEIMDLEVFNLNNNRI